MSFASPILAIFAALCALGAVAIVITRRVRLSMQGKIAAICSLFLLVLSSGSPHISWPANRRVVVLADFSDSTRGADYRNGKLIEQLSQRYHAEVIRFETTDGFTTFSPPAADAILLLSDGQFELPAFAPPTYSIVDPAFLAVKDASVQNLEYRNREIVATVSNSNDEATLAFSSNPARRRQITRGLTSIADSLPGNSDAITARIDSNDLWPENNALTIAPSPPLHLERWWIGSTPPNDDWRKRTPGDLPDDLNRYLLPSVIVLDATSLDSFSPTQTTRFEQYVRELGGSLVLHDLPRQFAFSPLSDSPPAPTRRWVVLCDVSGSMAQSAGEERRIDKAITAVRALVPTLPANDRVDVAGFARDLTWWTSGKSAIDTSRVDFVPKDLSPSGPTNLGIILQKLTQEAADNLPAAILVLSDAEADLPNLDSLVASLKSANAQVFLLQIGESVSPAVDRLIEETGGKRLPAGPDEWSQKLQSLAAAASGERVESDEIWFRSNDREYRASHVRESWLKEGAKVLTRAQVGERALPVAAEWMVGSGRVVAIAADSRDFATDLALAIASPPADPHIKISIETGDRIRLRVDAKNEQGYLNGLSLSAQIGTSPAVRIPQVAPGEYDLSLLSPQSPSMLTIYRDGQAINRIALAGRYPREFAKIGLNRENLQALAQRTGGKVIEANRLDKSPVLRKESWDIAPILLILASVCMGILLWQWKTGKLLA